MGSLLGFSLIVCCLILLVNLLPAWLCSFAFNGVGEAFDPVSYSTLRKLRKSGLKGDTELGTDLTSRLKG